jgi:hypothetical protein
MSDKTVILHDLVDAYNIEEVIEEIRNILLMISGEADLAMFDKIAHDAVLLFDGKYPGYRASNTKYHDLVHTCSVTLAFARLLHGASVENIRFKPENVIYAIAAALFHDVGLIQTIDDADGTGAKYTVGHEQRSIDFLQVYFKANRFGPAAFEIGEKCIMCTILNLPPGEISFSSDEVKLLAYMVGSADILAQMADREYLEKLLLLFQEFEEAGLPEAENELELLQNTEGFYYTTALTRLREGLDNMSRHMKAHFIKRWNIDRDMYGESIKNNIGYIRSLSVQCKDSYACYLDSLRRGGIVQKILDSK